MCGIAGIFNPWGIPATFKDKDRIKSMTLALHHRGPDERGLLFSNIAYLGHARLSIIDLSTGSQPMITPDKQLAVVFNGEIFNYVELADDLKKRGHVFYTASDTEILLVLYREYGTGMLEYLNGQFAFALIDFEKQQLFAARDRIGIRPFYYSFIGDTFFFASSIKSITRNVEVKRDFNHEAFHQLINFWTTYGKTTFVENIYSLSPGECLVYSQKNKKTSAYWDLHFPSENAVSHLSIEEWKEQTKSVLEKSLALQMRSDVPVNSYLSGGIDSSIVLKLIAQNNPSHFESFSVRFSERYFDEREFQMLMTEQTGIKNNFVEVSSSMIGDVFEQVIWHCEQPIFRTAPAPLFHLSKLVQQNGFKVVLTGEGADEIAWGYDIFKETLIRHHLGKSNADPVWLKRILQMNAHLPQYNKRYEKFLSEFYKNSLYDLSSPFFSHQIRMSNGQYILNFLQPSAKNKVIAKDVKEETAALLPREFNQWHPLQKAQYLEMKTLLSGYLLSSQGDRMSMSHSVEGRYPFLDHHVVDYFAGMPHEIKLQEMEEKFVLKKAFEELLPLRIIERRKYPYRAPEGISLLHLSIEEKYFNPIQNQKFDFFNWEYVERLRNKVSSGQDKSVFVDNATLVIIVSTMMFMEMLANNFCAVPMVKNATFHEITI